MKFFKIKTFCLSIIIISGPLYALPSDMDNPLNTQKFQVQSWKSLRDDGIVKQDKDFSCGAASLATLLNNYYGTNFTEDDLLIKMGKGNARASFLDMQRVVRDYGFIAKGYALSFEQLMQLKIPVIVYLNYHRNDHFSVLRGVDENTIVLADSSLGNITMSKAQFLNVWQTRNNKDFVGKILAIIPNDGLEQHFLNEAYFIHHPHQKTSFIIQLIKHYYRL